MVLVAFYELANQSVFIQAEYGQAVKACIWERKMRLSLQFTDIQEDALALACARGARGSLLAGRSSGTVRALRARVCAGEHGHVQLH